MTANAHLLVGCRPEPLGRYLKALGVLRLVTEQADPRATGHWTGAGFVLTTALDQEQLECFLLQDYCPTPILSPWNNSSGFGKEGVGELHVIESSKDPRLADYRAAIAVARDLLAEQDAGGWPKERMLQECRSRLPDACLPWLDAAAVLTDGRPVYPPILGTGGNDGRLEFSRNFHQRVLDVLALATRRGADPGGWLVDALYDLGSSVGIKETAGQFDPSASNGANAAASAPGVLNPWDWVLLVEGSVLLASGSSRRLATNSSGRAAAPFTVDASGGGYPSAADAEKSRGELWTPLWSRPTGLTELIQLFAEGRADWRGRHAGSGLDLAKAAASLGVDRGITAFARHVFLERYGLATVAVPSGRIEVTHRAEVAPLSQLDPWLERVRRGSNPPQGVRTGLHRLDRASFALTSGAGAGLLLDLLVAAADLELAVGRATSFRDAAGLRPITGLNARAWLTPVGLDSQPAEVRVAAGLASLRGQSSGRGPGLLRALLRPVESAGQGLEWTTRPPVVGGLPGRPVAAVLAEALARRALLADSGADPDQPGVRLAAPAGLWTGLNDMSALVAGQLDLDRLADLLAAFLLLDWRHLPDVALARPEVAFPVPLAVVGPFFATHPQQPSHQPGDHLHDTADLVPERHWAAALAAGRLDAVLPAALRRLRIAGLKPVPRPEHMADQDAALAHRLGAALHLRLHPADRRALLLAICPPDLDLDTTPSEGALHAAP